MIVHQLHYALGHEGGASAAGTHAYLPMLAMAAGLAVVVAAAWFMRSLRAARAGMPVSVGRSSYAVRWLTLAAALLTVFVVQEAVEAALVAGPAAALAAGHAVPSAALLSLAVAGVFALLLSGADAVISAAVRAAGRARASLEPSWSCQLAPAAVRNVLSENLAGRAPPLAV